MDVMLGPVGRSQTSIRPWSQRRPENLYDALVRAAPFQEIEESIAEQDELREILADALDELTEEEQWIFLMLTTVRLSLRFVGRVLDVPKTTLARRRDRIIQKLQAALLESPVIHERIRSYSSES
tara:strand:- start:573 stop:947 length:375 start_codon:yes stop_codon:yes gene_type:complete